MKKSKYAPIVLFVYNRPDDTINTIKALKKNKLASESELFIFSDGYKNIDSKSDVDKVRDIIRDIKGFLNVTIYLSEENKGLASSVISGVSKIINKYDRVIVIEDDLITSNDFLNFMNDGLDTYKNRNDIWSISGYNSPAKIPNDYKYDIYLAPRGSSWGWATWANRWSLVDWNVNNFEKLNKVERKRFELGGNDLYLMLELQMLGKIDSWAVRWVYSQFINSMYTIYPCSSKIRNEGIKQGGTHGNSPDSRWMTEVNDNELIHYEDIKADLAVLKVFKKYQDLDYIGRISYFSHKYNFYKKIKFMKKFLRK